MTINRRTLLKSVLATAPLFITSTFADETAESLSQLATRNPQLESSILSDFLNPPQAAKPGVYWFFMDANLSKAGMKADLEAMHQAGLGRAICLEVALGAPKGNVDYMTPEWLDHWKFAAEEAQKQGIELTIAAGPGWCGAGGPWISPEHAMQHLRSSVTTVSGPTQFDGVLPVPTPHEPFFGRGSLGPCAKDWQEFYRDVAVIAFPTPQKEYRISDYEEKALFYRAAYSSMPGVKPFLLPDSSEPGADSVVEFDKIVDISRFMDADGRLQWTVPEGNWTILRLGRRLTGSTTRPAPQAGLGLECDKFEKFGFSENYQNFVSKYMSVGKFTTLHHDSWEMSSQNWSEHFRQLFIQKRGYDPLPWTPTFFGIPVQSVEKSERFLWDLRHTAQELVYENNVEFMKNIAHQRGMTFSTEAYDLNPAGDMYLFRSADVPMGEFWSTNYGLSTEFSVFEAVSSGHTCGKKIIGAESFTSGGDKWRQHPAVMKQQADWALCAGINRFIFHRMFHQPTDDHRPGYSLAIHGIHWDRTQTWWSMADGFHQYVARCQALLQRGVPSCDILYLDKEGAPTVFVPPQSALTSGQYKDKKEYSFDGCCPQTLIDSATVKDGRITFPDGTSYAILVLPQSETMTVGLAKKLRQLKDAGATIVGTQPQKSPSLEEIEQDEQVRQLTAFLPKQTNEKPEFQLWDSVKASKWLWSDADYSRIVPGVTKKFVREFELPEAFHGKGMMGIAADNVFTVTVNGVRIGTGEHFTALTEFSITSALKPGKNRIEALILNGGDHPTPAGFIAVTEIRDADMQLIIQTDSSWTCEDKPAVELGPYNMGPWGFNPTMPKSPYPHYEQTCAELAKMGVVPDFTSTGDVRWIHRIDGQSDIYFIGNRTEDCQTVECTFRATGNSVQLWNPYSGKRYRVESKQVADGRTTITIPFTASQSWFVVFESGRSVDEAELPSSKTLLEESRAVLTIPGPWSVTFHQDAATGRTTQQGQKRTVTFDKLTDWTENSDPMIRYYSGQAVYETEFGLVRSEELGVRSDAKRSSECIDSNNTTPHSSLLTPNFYQLDLGTVSVMATVELNGQKLGTLWLAPWTVEIPADLLKPTGNKLKITVANLWSNRLIGDAALPDDQKCTWTTQRFYNANEPLQPSGLIGPVRIYKR